MSVPTKKCAQCGLVRPLTEFYWRAGAKDIQIFLSGTAPTTASNPAAVEFPEATGNWGTIVAAGIFDASTSGNLIAFANLTTSQTIDTGDVLRFNTGEIDITLD